MGTHVAKRVHNWARPVRLLMALVMAVGFVVTGLVFAVASTGVVNAGLTDRAAQSVPVPAKRPLAPASPKKPRPTVSAVEYVRPVLGATGTVAKTFTLPDIALGAFQNAVLPGTIQDDRGAQLGSIGSGLFPIDDDEYWTVTDRGPNPEIRDDVRTFVVPAFAPALVHIRVVGASIEVVESIPVTDANGTPVTGLPNRTADDESVPLAADGQTVLPHNINGLDPEGVVRTSDGHFWISDEYAPSIVELDAKGRILKRHLPAGLEDVYRQAGVAYPVDGALPAALQNRKANRGLEDLALLPDGKTLVAALQSSLVVPGDKDRTVTELITFDTAARTTLHEFPYQFDDPATFGDRGRKLKISALTPVDANHVMVQERTDDQSRYYLVPLDPADDLIAGADKQLVVNLAGVPGVPAKIEGAVLTAPDTLLLAADDDFGLVPRAYGSGEQVQDSGVRTQFVEVKLG
jgi:hypothetical protein